MGSSPMNSLPSAELMLIQRECQRMPPFVETLRTSKCSGYKEHEKRKREREGPSEACIHLGQRGDRQVKGAEEDEPGRECANLAQEQDSPAAEAVGPLSQDRCPRQLKGRVRGADRTVDESVAPSRVTRKTRNGRRC